MRGGGRNDGGVGAGLRVVTRPLIREPGLCDAWRVTERDALWLRVHRGARREHATAGPHPRAPGTFGWRATRLSSSGHADLAEPDARHALGYDLGCRIWGQSRFSAPEKNELVLSIVPGCTDTVPFPREINTPF